MDFNRTDFYDAELKRLDPQFRAAMRVAPGDRVLDAGCGSGFWTEHALKAGARVVAFDPSEEMVKHARKRVDPVCVGVTVGGDVIDGCRA